jgi:hypothetical protein
MSSEEDLVADVDEPPDLERTPRPSTLKLLDSFKAFSKTKLRCERKESLLSSALHSDTISPVEEHIDSKHPSRGMSCISTGSNTSASTAELTSDGGPTTPDTRADTPSPPLPASSFYDMAPTFNKKSFEQRVTIARNDDELIGPLEKNSPLLPTGEQSVEENLGRKRCISFACGPKTERKAGPEQPKPTSTPQQTLEPQKRACTIKFACPTKISVDGPSKGSKARATRAVSPAPVAQRPSSSSQGQTKSHRGSDSTVRNSSPIAMRKRTPDRIRRLSTNADLARCEAFRFHEFASSEEEIDEWTQVSTCHRQPLTIKDTLKVENSLRQLGEEAEEEAVDEEDDDLVEGEDDDDLELDDDDDEQNDSDIQDDVSSDEGFQTDDEEGFAGSDDDSDAGSDYNWWAPGHSTAATSIELLDHIRPTTRRSVSESSIGSVGSGAGNMRYRPKKTIKRRSSRPVNIRIPSPELPDSTDFVCGTLDEDRPLEAAYMSALERRRAAKHKTTPQDVDPTFPTSDPEMDEEDDDEPDCHASESDAYLMLHGHMDNPDGEHRGRRKSTTFKRSPLPSPKRLRSPPPAKRTMHRSPPPRKLFGQSPRRLRSPPAPTRLRSPPPTRRGSSIILSSPKNSGLYIQFAGLAGRPALITSSSLPRTPVTVNTPDFEDDEDTPNEFPMRRAIDIKVGLEKKRQRRKEQLYKKMQRKGTKDKRPAPGKGAERMREVGLGLAAHKGKVTGFGFQVQPTSDQQDMRILSV